jgi:vitamin B12/bleomycin/antimicrobial peptide transport system ATP-binding/permease protein
MERMDAEKKPQTPAASQSVGNSDGAIAQLKTLLRALVRSRRRRQLGLLTLGVVVVICANAAGQIRLNIWQRDFYQAIEQRHMGEFITQLMVFAVIAGGLLVLVVSQTWVRAMVNVRLREWLTHDLLDQWLVRKRVYMLGFAGEIGVNPDQRIQQDAQHLTELTTMLAIGLLQSSLLLMSFTGVLWVLSDQVVFDFGNGPVVVPGYMVWCALAYSLGGSLLAWHIGQPLIPLNERRYAREADLRIALVRISEHADGIALHDGEADERRLLNEPVDGVVTIMTRLANGLARLTWITSGYGWLAMVVPIVVAAPGYFGGHMSFGTLMMVIGAFNQVQGSLRWFVDNLPQIADWRATLGRVVAFREALAAVDSIGTDTGRIEVVDSASDRLELADLQLALPDTCATLDQSQVTISAGERIQILGKAAAGKSTLFRALAGMWPWGAGTLRLPPREAMTFMPQRPYLPLGTLRAAVCYPAEPGHFDEAAVVAALERMDLGHLLSSLDRTERWDRQLPLDEQQRLAVARLLLHAPRWVVLDDAISALGDSHRRLVLSLPDCELVGATLIRVGQNSVLDDFWNRTLHIIERPGGPHLRTDPPPRAGAADALPTASSENSAAGGLVDAGTANDGRSATSRKDRQER